MNFPSNGVVGDFFPGFGKFETETYWVDTFLGTTKFELVCGSLPGMLGMILGSDPIYSKTPGRGCKPIGQALS